MYCCRGKQQRSVGRLTWEANGRGEGSRLAAHLVGRVGVRASALGRGLYPTITMRLTTPMCICLLPLTISSPMGRIPLRRPSLSRPPNAVGEHAIMKERVAVADGRDEHGPAAVLCHTEYTQPRLGAGVAVYYAGGDGGKQVDVVGGGRARARKRAPLYRNQGWGAEGKGEKRGRSEADNADNGPPGAGPHVHTRQSGARAPRSVKLERPQVGLGHGRQDP